MLVNRKRYIVQGLCCRVPCIRMLFSVLEIYFLLRLSKENAAARPHIRREKTRCGHHTRIFIVKGKYFWYYESVSNMIYRALQTCMFYY